MPMTAKEFSLRFPEVKDKIASKHAEFLGKFKKAFLKKTAEQEMSRDKIYAKILLVAKLFVEARVVDETKDVDVTSSNGTYSRSIAFYSKMSPFIVYLLNDGENVIISDSVVIPPHAGFDERLELVSANRRAHVEVKNVLSPEFDWESFCLQLLNAIHVVIYNRSEVIREQFLAEDANG